ncbi:MAG: carbamate kinase [Deltaproteobacteria bacterium]|nr:carbamate kinase [Deltaproteobacteria bacterium]MBI4223888.1 carbamate kinase [Deltaproteobacteria bacterium]
MRRLLIALGGNALPPGRKRLEKILAPLKPLAKGRRILLTHGNGPDVGYLLLQQEKAKRWAPAVSLDILDARTQGALGYRLQQALSNLFRREAATVITRVSVDPKDPAFEHPAKPVGPYYRRPAFKKMVFIRGKGYRRVVPSPRPIRILEARTIRELFRSGKIVIAGGGGGIPVARKNSTWAGVEAVIDKDLCAAKLARLIRADTLLILTDVEGVYLNFGKRNQKKLSRLSAAEAKRYLRRGEFGRGDMGPKIEAGLEFLRHGGRRFFIGHLQKIEKILGGESGTQITP